MTIGGRRAAVALAAGVLGPGLCAAAPAGAAVRIGPREVIVTLPGARAVVQRAPFRLAVQTASGRTVLREVSDRSTPRTLAPTLDPEPFGVDQQPDPAVYAPLTFTVGTEERALWHGAFWAGDLLFARRAGTEFSARAVVGVRREGAGARLVLSTDDPSGHRVIVTLGPDRVGAVRVSARFSPGRDVVSAGDSFATDRREAFHGFGGQHYGLDQRGHRVYGWIEQENIGGPRTLAAAPALPAFLSQGTDFTFAQLGSPSLAPRDLAGGAAHYLFPGGPSGAYYVQEQFVSSRPYGFLLNSAGLARWRMASDRRDAWQVAVDGAGLDYTVAVGRGREAIRALTAITGRHRLPPAWAQGPMLSRAVQNTGRETADTYAARVRGDLADIRRLRPPLAAYAFEGWATLDPVFVRETIAALHRLGIRAVLYLRPYVSNDALHTAAPGQYEQVLAQGLVARHADGAPFVYDASGAPAALLDFTNPATVRLWRERVSVMLGLGGDGFMEDFGEQVQDGMRFHDGSTGAQMHNRYAVLYHRVSRGIVDAFDRAHRRRQPTWFYTRAGFSGRPGSAAFEMGNFPGDETVDWSESSGIASLTPDMLNRAVGGAFGFTTDIGGYTDLLTGPANAELFTRWSEWSALTPYFRVHNSGASGTRTPWSYGQTPYRRWLSLARLHDRALPLIRRLWRAGLRTGIPVTRPLWLADPGDARAAAQDQEWLLGANVLVAPVVEEGATGRSVYFPPGCWRNPPTGGRVRGPSTRRVAAPLGRLPYFVRCGTNL